MGQEKMAKRGAGGAALSVFCIAAVVAAVLYFLINMLSPRFGADVTSLESGWTDPAGGQAGAVNVLSPPVAPGETKTFVRQLDGTAAGKMLSIEFYHNRYRLLLDGEPVAGTPEMPDGGNTGHRMDYAVLPDDFAGGQLELEITGLYDNVGRSIHGFVMGDYRALASRLLARTALEVVFMTICVVGGLLLMFLALVSRLRQWNHWASFMAGVFSVLWGLYGMSIGDGVFLFLGPLDACHVEIVLEQLYHLPLVGFLYSVFERHKKFLWPAFALTGVNLAVLGLRVAVAGQDLIKALGLSSLMNQCIFVYVVAMAIVEYAHKNRFLRAVVPWGIPLVLSWCLQFMNVFIFLVPWDFADFLYEMSFFILIMVVWAETIRSHYRTHVSAQNQLFALEMRNALALESYREMEWSLEQAERLKHDLKNQLVALQMMLEKGEHERMRRYLNQLGAQPALADAPIYCKNFLVNALLVSKLAAPGWEKLALQVEAEVPERLEIADLDLSSLLSNILDNALEASEKVGEGAFIHLTLRMQDLYLYIRCENAAAQRSTRVDGRIVSSKAARGETHGLGLGIIEGIVERYGGMMEVQEEEGRFILTAALRNARPANGRLRRAADARQDNSTEGGN